MSTFKTKHGFRRSLGLAALILIPVLFTLAKNSGEHRDAATFYSAVFNKLFAPISLALAGSEAALPAEADNALSADCCDQGDKPQKITAIYTGEDCSATVTSQSTDKYDCSGDPAFDGLVYIIANDKDNPNDGKVWFSGNVALGESFVIDATAAGDDDLASATFVHVFSSLSGTLLQSVEFHTSCSQSLSLDDQYGSIDIDGILFKDGVTCGAAPPPPPADCCDQGDKPQRITAIYTGEDCSATATGQDPGKYDCSGDPAFDGQVYIIANDNSSPTSGKVWFTGDVALGESFVIDATLAGDDDLSSETFVHVFASQGGALLQSVEFHTSCSQPITEEDQYGSIAIDGILFKNGVSCGTAPPPPPPGSQDCCDIGDKPQKITAIYTGEDCNATATSQSTDKYDCSGNPNFDGQVYIIANDNSSPTSGKVWFTGDVALGESFVIDATLAGDDDLSSETFVHVFASQGGALLQSVEFHTSCSQPITEEDQYGAIAIDGILFKNGVSCGTAPPPPPPGSQDCCDIGDKPQKITAVYTGEDCSATATGQDPGKYDCSGDPAFDGQVYIIANDNSSPTSGKVWFTGDVALGESFVIDATLAGDDDLSNETFVHVFASQGGALLQSVEFHTSCSQPITEEDQYGSIAIDGILFKNGVTCGTAPPPPPPGSQDCCDIGDKPQKITAIYTGEDCSATATGQDPGKYDCSGDPAFDGQVYIIANDKDNPNDGKIWFSGNVSLGGSFVIDATAAGDDDLASETFVHVFSSQGGTLLQTVEFHTSCSQPISIDDQYGSIDIALIQFKDGTFCGDLICTPCNDGGLIGFDESNCGPFDPAPIVDVEPANCAPATPPSPADCCDVGDKPQKITAIYTGESCSATVTNQGTDKYNCSGNPAFDNQVYIIANDDSNPNSGKIWFSGSVALNGTFVIDATLSGDDDLSSATFVHVFSSQGGSLLQSVEFHTSCSQPLSVDDQYGSIDIQSILFKDGSTCGSSPDGSNFEYQWISSTGTCPSDISQAIPGAIGASYDPPLLDETTYFVRLARRTDCTDGQNPWVPSNCVTKEVQPLSICNPASLGNFVWEDENGNGLQDPGEPGVPNIPVELQDCFGNFIASTTTDANGNYLFDNLPPGGYVVVFGPLPGDFEFTLQDEGGNDAIDSDAGMGGMTTCVDLESGEENLTVDAGIFAPASLGDLVFEDTNGNGLQDGGEPGVPNVPVELQDCFGNTITSTTTDANGNYLFAGLEPGGYVVVFGLPTGFEYTTANVGGNDAIDSDAGMGGATGCIELESGEENLTVDAGIFEPASLGDLVFEDTNGNGLQDGGEPGVPNVPVELQDCFGNTITSTTTDANGNYLFAGLEPGGYVVVFGLPTGFEYTTANVGGNDAIDSDAGMGGATGCIELESGEENLTVDAGIIGAASLGDLVFEDTNGNGLQDGGEPGVPNVPVELQDCFGNTITSTTTDANGNYLFAGLEPGGYVVVFGLPTGFEYTTANVGGNDAIDSDAGMGGATGCIELESGEENLTVDAGIIGAASLGDLVFEDTNGNGLQDGGEPGVPNVPVELQDCFGNTITSTTTDANGNYLFAGLEPGGYVVVFGLPAGFEYTTANVGGNDAIDSDAGMGGATGCIELESGEEDLTVDAGIFAPASLGDFVWEDLNANGIQDGGEPGIPNVEVNLKDENGNVVSTDFTDANGAYSFTGLAPGTYSVMFMGPDGFTPTPQDQGGDDTADSDADAAGNTIAVTLASGEDNPTIDAGFYQAASLGDLVFEDTNGNGLQDGGEPGVPNVPVELQDCFGNTITSTTTDANGNYLFAGLEPGGYVVVFGLPTGFEYTTANVGGDDAIDSDAGMGGATGCIELESGEEDLTVDAGIFAPASLGDFVWEDLNANGIQDGGEPGIPNVEVNLKDENGNVVSTDFTDANGAYSFTGLAPGTYSVMFMGPDGFTPTPQDQGGDDTADSDADAAGNTIAVTLASGEDNPTIDAGFYQAASLGDLVFEDTNGNGLQDGGEPGVPNVPVELQDCFGNTITSTTTDANGNYLFAGLEPGGYVVVFGLPTGFEYTTANVGGDDAIDSDAGMGGATGCIELESGEEDLTVDAGVLVPCGSCYVKANPAPLCPNGVKTYYAPISGECDNPVYHWTISGNGTIIANNGSSVNVRAGTTCGVPFTVSVTIDCEGCTPGTINCGSFTTNVKDVTPPEIVATNPALIEALNNPRLNSVDGTLLLECPSIPSQEELLTWVSGVDDCDNDVRIKVLLPEDMNYYGDCSEVGYRRRWTAIWTATDDCQNSSRLDVEILQVDTEAPTITGVPDDVTVSCDHIPAPATPSVTDICDMSPGLSFEEMVSSGDCSTGYTITRTWTATDDCGNTAVETQAITVQGSSSTQGAGTDGETNPSGEIVFGGNAVQANTAESSATATLSVWPVPSSGEVTLELRDPSNPEQAEVRIYSLDGKLVYRQMLSQPTRHTLNLSNKGTGMFLVEVISGDQILRERMIIQ